MNIPVTTSLSPEHRVSVLLGSQLERSESKPAGLGRHYAEVLTKRIPEHRGAVIDSEDSLVLAEFEDAAEAVNCAIDIQGRLAQYNKLHLDESPLGASIGIHCGELYFSEGSWKGTGVDVAMELLSLVPPSAVYVTRDVFVRVRLLLPLKFESIGKKVFSSSTGEKDLFSVAWKSVTENLEASLRRLGEDDLQRADIAFVKIWFRRTKKGDFTCFDFFALFVFVLLKVLKLL